VVKTIGIVAVAAFAARTAGVPDRGDHGDLVANKIGSHRRQSVVLAVGPPIHDLDRFAVVVAGLAQSFDEIQNRARVSAGGIGGEISNQRHRRPLRTRSQRPRRGCAADHSDELAPPHLGPQKHAAECEA